MSKNSFWANIPPVTKNLIIINFIIWLAMMLFPARVGELLSHYCALYFWKSPSFNPAQVFTYMFLHSTVQVEHLFFNMFTLFMFGMAIEHFVGSKRFLYYYIACGVMAALIQEGVFTFMYYHYLDLLPQGGLAEIESNGMAVLESGRNYAFGPLGSMNILMNGSTVGASGAIYGLLLAYGMLFPNRYIYLYFLVPIKAKYMVMIWGALELFLGFTGSDSVAHFCHLGGMIAGIIILLYWKHKGLFRNDPWQQH